MEVKVMRRGRPRRFLVLVMLALMTALAGCGEGAQMDVSNTTTKDNVFDPHLLSIAYQTGEYAFIDPECRLVVVTPEECRVVPAEGRVCGFSWADSGDEIALVVEDINQGKRNLVMYNVPNHSASTIPQFSDEFLEDVSWAPLGGYVLLDYKTAAGGNSFKIVKAGSWEEVLNRDYVYDVCWSFDYHWVAYGVPVDTDPPIPLEGGRSSSVVITYLTDGRDEVIAQGTSREMYYPYSGYLGGVVYYRLSEENNFAPELWAKWMGNRTSNILTDYPFPFNRDEVKNSLPANIRDSFADYTLSKGFKHLGIWCGSADSYDIYVMDREKRSLTHVGPGNNIRWNPQGADSRYIHKKTMTGKSQNWDFTLDITYNAVTSELEAVMNGTGRKAVKVKKLWLELAGSGGGGWSYEDEDEDLELTRNIRKNHSSKTMRLKDGRFHDFWHHYSQVFDEYPPYVTVEWIDGGDKKEERIDFK